MRPYQFSTLTRICSGIGNLGELAQEKTYLASCSSRVVRGVRVAVAPFWAPASQYPADASEKTAFDQIDDALRLLEECASFIVRGLARRRVTILIDQPPSPFYWALSNTIHIPISMVIDKWPTLPASTIVHEWTHARVHAARRLVA